jgi:type I restriction enzyme, S subunit
VESVFGEKPADWQMQPLSQVFSKVSRKNARAVTRVLTASGESGLVDQRTFFTKSIAAADVSGYYLLERGEFAYNRSAMNGYPYGAIKRLDAHDEGVLSTLYSCFAIKKDRGDADFYMHFFEVGFLNRQLRRITQVGGRAHGLLNITDSDFFSVSIPVPTLKEQRAIAAVLDTADRELKSLEDKLAALKEQKKA